MLIVQRKINYHPPKRLNKQKSNAEQTIKTNQQTKKQNQKKNEEKNTLNKFMGFARNDPR
jgi:hypothetical protein